MDFIDLKVQFQRLEGSIRASIPTHYISAYAQYSVTFASEVQRRPVVTTLSDRSIPTVIYYSKPLHSQSVFADMGYAEGALPVSDEFSHRILSLPMYPFMSKSNIGAVCDAIRDAVHKQQLDPLIHGE